MQGYIETVGYKRLLWSDVTPHQLVWRSGVESYLSMRCTCHVDSVDLYDLVTGLQTAVRGDQTLVVNLLNNNASLKGGKIKRFTRAFIST